MKITNLKRAVLLRNSHFVPRTFPQPTGQGTGLGLSNDIIKAHGGELKVETLPAEAAAQAGKEARPDDPEGRGDGCTFIIQLPF